MGRPSQVIPPSTTVYAVVLTAGTPWQVQVPSGALQELFSATGPFWARVGGAAQLPTADVLDGSAPELNPAARAVTAGSAIGLVAPATCTVSLAFYG